MVNWTAEVMILDTASPSTPPSVTEPQQTSAATERDGIDRSEVMGHGNRLEVDVVVVVVADKHSHGSCDKARAPGTDTRLVWALWG